MIWVISCQRRTSKVMRVRYPQCPVRMLLFESLAKHSLSFHEIRRKIWQSVKWSCSMCTQTCVNTQEWTWRNFNRDGTPHWTTQSPKSFRLRTSSRWCYDLTGTASGLIWPGSQLHLTRVRALSWDPTSAALIHFVTVSCSNTVWWVLPLECCLRVRLCFRKLS